MLISSKNQILPFSEEIQDPKDQIVLTVDDDGIIHHCSSAASKLMQCPANRLVRRHISTFLPQLACTVLTQQGQLNPRLRYLSRIGHRFELAIPDRISGIAQLFFNDLESYNGHFLRLIIRPLQPAAPSNS